MSARLERTTLGGAHASPGVPLTHHTSRDPFVVKVPTIDPALIMHLRDIFKVRVTPHLGLRDYDLMAGQQEVIEYLATQYQNQKG